MLNSIELENFKAFGARTRVPMAPITLVLGENSAGKSSILQALTLLKQSHTRRQAGATLLPRAADGITDLGSFNELLHDHESSRTLHLALELTSDFDDYGPTRTLVRTLGLDTILVDLAFTREPNDKETRFSGFELRGGPRSETLAHFETTSQDSPDVLHDTPFRPLFVRHWASHRFVSSTYPPGFTQPLHYGRCTAVGDWPDLWSTIHEHWSHRRQQILSTLNDPEDPTERSPDWPEDLWFSVADKRPPLSSLDETKAFFSTSFTASQLRSRMVQWCKQTTVSLDGFMPYSSPLASLNLLPELAAMNRLIQMGRLPVLDLGWFVNSVPALLDNVLTKLFPLGPWRRPPERHYLFSGTSPHDVGYSGAAFPLLLYRRPELVKQANEWLQRLDVGHELKVTQLGRKDSDLFELRLADKRRNKSIDVALTDVGFGVSQILPFIIQCLIDSNRLISIEQPEVHIHPRLQAELGELIACCVSEPYHHRFLIETHSEHLVLRFQKLVRTGLLTPDDISIVFLSRTAQGTKIKRLRLDEDGDFMDEWPGGFFPERLRELR